MATNTNVNVTYQAYNRSQAATNQFIHGLHNATRTIAGLTGSYIGLRSAIQGLTAASREMMKFETGMAKISTMLNDQSKKYIPMLEQEITRLSMRYGKGADDLQAATYKILSNQIAVNHAMGILEQNLKAAKGGFTDVTTTIQASLGVMKAYRYEADKIDDILNVMQKTVERGNLTFEDIAQNIGTVSSSAAVLKVDFEVLGAVIATLTRAGVPLDTAFTSLRNILAKFKDPTKEAIQAAKELGFSLDETSIQGQGLINVFEKLQKANAKQLSALMPSIRGFEGFAAGLQNAADMSKDYQYMLSDVDAVQRAFNTSMATSQSQMDRANEGWKTFGRWMGDTQLIKNVKEIYTMTGNMAGNFALGAENLNNYNSELEEYAERLEAINELSTTPFPTIEVPLPPGKTIKDMERESAEQISYIYMAHRLRAAQYVHGFKGPLPGTEYDTGHLNITPRSQWKDIYDIPRQQRDTAQQKERADAAKRMASLSGQVNMEIELMGRLSEPRQHARMAVEYQAEAAKRYGANTKEAIAATEAFADQLDRLEMAEKWAELADTMENSITNAFDQMIFEGAKFKDVMKQLARDILREFMRVMVFRTISQGITGSINSMFAPSAMGNVFHRGRLVPMAAGGIIDRPTLLPYAGEAGPEAVMPLRRAPSGRLGVEASASAPIINTYTLEPVTVNAKRQNNRWVLDIVANGMTNYGPLKRGVRQAARSR